jgi:DNA/RNA endonuclease YhcR with UshA esterase domain
MIRYNSDTSKIESYQGGTWVNFFTATGNAVTVSSGGTGLTTLTANNLLVGNGTGNITFIAPGSSGNVIQSNGTTLSSVAKIASGNAVTTTSGSSVDFTSIPSYAKRITMILSGVSLTGTDNLWARIGSGSFTTSGYTSQAIKANGSTGTATAGFYVAVGTGNISTYYGQATFYNITGNTWVFTSVIADIGNTSGNYSSGSIALSGTLDRIQLLPSGSNTFDAGIVNVFWE